MAMTVTTNDPRTLLEAIKQSIKDGKIETWRHKDGYFTHSPDQWRAKAFIKPSIDDDTLTLNIIRPANSSVSTEVYAVYHGRFIEMLLAHFDGMFDTVVATAMATEKDLV
jgi:hypothetical protein